MNALDGLLVYGPSWLGDSIMSMPALQMLKRQQPAVPVTVLARPHLAPLWRLHGAVDEVVELRDAARGWWGSVRRIRAQGFRRIVICPNSFRSAVIPFMARIPERVGRAGHQRRWLLTSVVEEPASLHGRHQAWEYANLLGLAPEELEAPRLVVPDAVVRQCYDRLSSVDVGGGWVGLIPGAARGPSKRWPADHFAAVGRMLIRAVKCRVLVFGTDAETLLCSQVSGAIGGGALNVAGATSLPDFAALLRLCRVVVVNDSGGMHLAAAVGTPVVAVFGITDPARTGPLGLGHRVICAPGFARSRAVAARSPQAARALLSIKPGQVTDAALAILRARQGDFAVL